MPGRKASAERVQAVCSLKECLIVVGILSGYLASYLLIDQVGGWRSMYGLAIIPAVGLAGGMVSSPKKPCFWPASTVF